MVTATKPQTKWLLKGCPRPGCGGDLYFEYGYDEDEWACFQCGRRYSVETILSMKRRHSGRLGGIAKFMHYGREHYREMGKKGGRPRLEVALRR